MRTCSLDLETTTLEAVGAGWLLCGVIKPLEGQPKVFRYDKYHEPLAHEHDLLRALINELGKYDLVVGHNLKKFDWNFLKSRGVQLEVEVGCRPFCYDTLEGFKRCGFLTPRNHFGKPIAALDFACDFFGLKQLKTKVGYPRQHWLTVWETNKRLRKIAVDNLVDHCIRDVAMTEQLYQRLLPLDTNAIVKRLS